MVSSEAPWRCFVAVPIPPELRDALSGYVAGLRRNPGLAEGWRWTDPEAWHVTLAFLGSTDPSGVPAITDALARVAADAQPFARPGGQLGAFPSARRARVLWYGVADVDGRLGDLARSVQTAVGMQPDSRFRGHLTLARARDRRGTDASVLLAAPPPPPGTVPVERLILFRSHLGRGPAHYEELASAPLGGGGG